jgi:hypothetical protein
MSSELEKLLIAMRETAILMENYAVEIAHKELGRKAWELVDLSEQLEGEV